MIFPRRGTVHRPLPKFERAAYDPSRPGLSEHQVRRVAEEQISSKSPGDGGELHDPAFLSGVLFALTAVQVDGIKIRDYGKSDRCATAMRRLRGSYRLRDVQLSHKDEVREFAAKVATAKEHYDHEVKIWAQIFREFDAETTEQFRELQKRQRDEVEALEREWTQPDAKSDSCKRGRCFRKKSPALLQDLTIEKMCVVTDRFVDALEMQKLNTRRETAEVELRRKEWEAAYGRAAERLRAEQQAEVGEFELRRQRARDVLKRDEAARMRTVRRRLDALRAQAADRSVFDHFVAMRFHRQASQPMTSTVVALEPALPGAAQLQTRWDLRKYREEPVGQPLPGLNDLKGCKRPKALIGKKPRRGGKSGATSMDRSEVVDGGAVVSLSAVQEDEASVDQGEAVNDGASG